MKGAAVASTRRAAVEPEAVTSPWRLAGRRFLRHRPAVVAAVVLGLLALACVAAPWIAPHPPNRQDLLLGPVPPSRHHWLGTDELGRDQFSRLLYAGRISLQIGLAVGLLSTAFGAAIGAVAGYAGRAADQVLMRITDLFLVLPAIAVLAIALKRFGRSQAVIVVVLAALFWMYVARVVRAEVLALREKEFVEAARAAGASGVRIVVRHLLPNVVGVVAVNATLAVAVAIITESTLSFLGFGVQPPATSWGVMLADAEGYVGTGQAYLLYGPGAAILLTVLCVNFIGDGLRAALDPRAGLR